MKVTSRSQGLEENPPGSRESGPMSPSPDHVFDGGDMDCGSGRYVED